MAAPKIHSVEDWQKPVLALDSSYFEKVDKKVAKHHRISLYDLPYSLTEHQPNFHRFWINTATLAVGGVAAIGILWALPEGTTDWNKKEIQGTPIFKLWWRHVKKGAEIDADNAVFNWILHPYGGAVYYMSARSSGFNAWYSLLCSFCVSTIWWEYGFEAFLEVPSVQDLLVTPLIGSVIGEGFYLFKRYIVAHDYRLFGSKILGNFFAFLIDPLNEFVGLFAGNECRGGRLLTSQKNLELACTPWIMQNSFQRSFGFSLSARF